MPTKYLVLIILAVFLNLLAIVSHFKIKKTIVAECCFALASLFSFSLFVFNWIDTGEPPFGNMYHVKVVLSFSFYPLWKLLVYCTNDKKLLPIFNVSAIIFCMASYFVWNGEAWRRPPALQSIYFVPHVMAYMIGYALATVAFISIFLEVLRSESEKLTRRYLHLFIPLLFLVLGVVLGWTTTYFLVVGAIYSIFLALSFIMGSDRFQLSEQVELGVQSYPVLLLAMPFITTGLVLGCLWAEEIWGKYWSWDNKETWSLITWFLYLTYFHAQKSAVLKKRSTVIHLLAYLALVVTFLAVNLLPKMASAMHSYAN